MNNHLCKYSFAQLNMLFSINADGYSYYTADGEVMGIYKFIFDDINTLSVNINDTLSQYIVVQFIQALTQQSRSDEYMHQLSLYLVNFTRNIHPNIYKRYPHCEKYEQEI